jgi:hypothetical protein
MWSSPCILQYVYLSGIFMEFFGLPMLFFLINCMITPLTCLPSIHGHVIRMITWQGCNWEEIACCGILWYLVAPSRSVLLCYVTLWHLLKLSSSVPLAKTTVLLYNQPHSPRKAPSLTWSCNPIQFCDLSSRMTIPFYLWIPTCLSWPVKAFLSWAISTWGHVTCVHLEHKSSCISSYLYLLLQV